MTRHVITLAGAFVAVACLTLGSADAEARHCRGRRNRCCQQTSNYGCQQGCNGNYRQGCNNGCQQGCNGGYYNGSPQQVAYPAPATACCTSQSTWNSTQSAPGSMQPTYNAPISVGTPVPAGLIVSPPSPAPGA